MASIPSAQLLHTGRGMPTSTYAHIATVARFLIRVRPTSVLDVGLGNGKMGFIVRDLLDVMLDGRHRHEDWKIRLDGIEAFGDYVQAHQRAIYNDIHVGDAFDVIDRLGAYDLVILGDVLEHFERARAERLLQKCFDHAPAIILNIPLGERWTQDAIYGNEYERHRSFWTWEDFEPMAVEGDRFDFDGLGAYGSFLLDRAGFRHARARNRCQRLAAAGRFREALASLETVSERFGHTLATELQVVEHLVQQQDFGRAVERLRSASRLFPAEAPSLASHIGQLEALVVATGQKPSEAEQQQSA